MHWFLSKVLRHAILHFGEKKCTEQQQGQHHQREKFPKLKEKLVQYFCSKYYAASWLMYKYSTNFVFHIPLVPSVLFTAGLTSCFLEIKCRTENCCRQDERAEQEDFLVPTHPRRIVKWTRELEKAAGGDKWKNVYTKIFNKAHFQRCRRKLYYCHEYVFSEYRCFTTVCNISL